MENISNRLKAYFLSIKGSMEHFLRRYVPQWPCPVTESPPTPPPTPPLELEAMMVEQEEQQRPEPIVFVAAHNAQQNLDWAVLIIGFCFTSAVDIALQHLQSRIQIPLTFHLLSLAMVFAFASLFVAKYISSKFPNRARALEHVGVLCSATAFFLAITISLPLSLKLTSWTIYALSVLAILICNNC